MNEHRLFAIQKHRKDLIISKSLKYNTVYHFKISKNKFQRFRILKWNKISRSVTQFKNISSFISTYFALKTSFYFLLELWALHCTITEETNTGACGALECTFSSAGALLVGGGSDFCGGWGGGVVRQPRSQQCRWNRLPKREEALAACFLLCCIIV